MHMTSLLAFNSASVNDITLFMPLISINRYYILQSTLIKIFNINVSNNVCGESSSLELVQTNYHM